MESFEPTPIPVSFLYSSQGRLPLKLRALLDFAAPRLRARLEKTDAALTSPRYHDTAQALTRNGVSRIGRRVLMSGVLNALGGGS